MLAAVAAEAATAAIEHIPYEQRRPTPVLVRGARIHALGFSDCVGVTFDATPHVTSDPLGLRRGLVWGGSDKA